MQFQRASPQGSARRRSGLVLGALLPIRAEDVGEPRCGCVARTLLAPCGSVSAGPRSRRAASSSAARSSRQRLDVVGGAKARVRLAVGDVRPETAVLDDHRLAADRIRAELAERRSGRRARPRCFGWASRASAWSSVSVKQLLLGLERPRVGALLDERPVAAVRRDDLLAVGGVDARRTGAARAA